MLENTGLQVNDLNTMDITISLEGYKQLVRNINEVVGSDNVLVALASHLPLTSHGMLGYACAVSPDRLSRIELFARYSKMRIGHVGYTVEFDGSYTEVSLEFAEELKEVFQDEINQMISFHIILLNTLFLDDYNNVPSVEIWLEYPKPDNFEQIKQYFLGEVYFDKPVNCIRALTSELQEPLLGSEPEAYAEAVEDCRKHFIKSVQSRSMRDMVENLFYSNPGKLWSKETVAKHLHMSPRTLQRKLASEGLSYREVQSDWLKKMAILYLGKEGLTIEATAGILGYHDEASLRRAFGRWFGCSVGEYLKNQAGETPSA